MPATREELYSKLERLGIKTRTVEHEAVFTVEQSRELHAEIPGGHSKNLFLKCKKGQYWLIVALQDTQVNLKDLHKKIGSGRLSFGKAEQLMDLLGVLPGSVTPFALINDKKGLVRVVLDKDMLELDLLNYHPLENTATTAIAREDLLKFIEATGHEPQIVELGGID